MAVSQVVSSGQHARQVPRSPTQLMVFGGQTATETQVAGSVNFVLFSDKVQVQPKVSPMRQHVVPRRPSLQRPTALGQVQMPAEQTSLIAQRMP